MATSPLILLTLILVIFTLNSWAIWRLFRSPYYSKSQCFMQTVIVIFLPFFGAFLVLYLLRTDTPTGSNKYMEHVHDAESVGFASNYDYGISNTFDINSHD